MKLQYGSPKQTGGIQGKTHTGKVAKRCSRILKDYIVQSANQLGLHGPQDLMTDYKRREAAGQHADFGIARIYLRTAMCLMRNPQIYLPPEFRNADPRGQTDLISYCIFRLVRFRRLRSKRLEPITESYYHSP